MPFLKNALRIFRENERWMMTPLESIFWPQSVAIIGASQNQKKRGFQAINSLLTDQYSGKIYPVNKKEKEILGLPVFESIEAIPSPIDLALIAVPASVVPEVLIHCGKKRIKGAVILSTGFAESGYDGKKLQSEIVSIARQHQIRIIGPNTSGLFNLHHRLNLTGIRNVPKGEIAILSQSGNIALSLITEITAKSKLGLSAYVGVGNEADIAFHEYLEYFQKDPYTRAILMFVDGMSEGRKFLQVAKETTQKKPIVLLKSGRSEKGRIAAQSHTGALSGLSLVSKTAFRRVGILTIDRSDELFPSIQSLVNFSPLRRNHILVLSDGGGHASLAVDALSDYFFKIPNLSNTTKEKLRAVFPQQTFIENPVDLAGATDTNPALFARCIQIILEDPDIDALLLVGLFGGYHLRFSDTFETIENETAHQIGKLFRQTGKPVVVQSLYASFRPKPLQILESYQIPVYESLDIAAKCLGVLAEYGRHLNIALERSDFVLRSEGKQLPEVLEIFQQAQQENRSCLLEHEARRALQLHQIPVADFEFARTEEEAVTASKKIGFPVALKIVSADILHKSEIGGVILKVKTENAVRDAFDLLVARARRHNPNARITGVIVSPMMPEGVEVIVGVSQDPQFGPVIMFGLGGVMVEVLKDVAFRVLPISRLSATDILNDIRAKPILDGVRGNPPCDREALIQLLMKISLFVEAYSDLLSEMDLNPVLVYEKNLIIVDVRILIKGVSHEKTKR